MPSGTFQGVKIIFFDLDNTLYPASSLVQQAVTQRILLYLQSMGMTEEEGAALGKRYSSDYGLAIRGLLKHHEAVCPRDYDKFVDGGIPLEKLLAADANLHAILMALKCKRWIFTNAGIKHTTRTLRCLGLSNCFHGITYCDYAKPAFCCKPEEAAYERAMLEAGCSHLDRACCLFIDDNFQNICAAKKFGWQTIFVSEGGEELDADALRFVDAQIGAIHEIEKLIK